MGLIKRFIFPWSPYPCDATVGANTRTAYLNLKKALLFFDKVSVVVPEIIFSDYFCDWIDMSRIDEAVLKESEQFHTLEYVLWRERFRRLHSFIEQTKSTHGEGVLIYVNPLQVMEWPCQTHFYSLPCVREVSVDEVNTHLGEVVFHSILADLNDASFRSLVQTQYPYSPGGFAVFKDQGEMN